MQKLLFDIGFNCVIKINGTNKEITILKDPKSEPLIIPFVQISEELKRNGAEEFALDC